MIKLMPKKGAVNVAFTERGENKEYAAKLNKQEAEAFLAELEDHLSSIGRLDKVKLEDGVICNDEIVTYSSGVERALNIRPKNEKMILSLITYAGPENENWIRLTPMKAVHLASIVKGYIVHFDWSSD